VKLPELDWTWIFPADSDFGRGFDSRRLHQPSPSARGLRLGVPTNSRR